MTTRTGPVERAIEHLATKADIERLNLQFLAALLTATAILLTAIRLWS